MSNDNVPPAIREVVVARPDRRLKELERRLAGIAAQEPEVGAANFPGFSFPIFGNGYLAPRWYAPRDISYVQARISCVTAAAGTGSFRLDLNGAALITLSLLSGENTHLYAAVFSIAKDSYLSGAVTASAGQLAASVQLYEAE